MSDWLRAARARVLPGVAPAEQRPLKETGALTEHDGNTVTVSLSFQSVNDSTAADIKGSDTSEHQTDSHAFSPKTSASVASARE